jgi:aminoglycoside phosphotransferase (APT) family kinase protein
MDRLPGEAIPRRLLRDERYARARDVMIGQLGAILAKIHDIDPQAPGLVGRLAAPTAGDSPAAVEIDRLMGGVRGLSVEPHPVLDLTERWLREHLPRQRPVGVVHGDYRIGNVLFDEDGVCAILDWELAHLGDPVEDLAWLCVRAWRFGNDAQSAGGIGTREELVRAYESAGGAEVDPAVLRFWEVCGNLKLALVFITQARVHLDGGHRSVELASLGRRTAEAEEELLRLIEGEG